MEPIFAFFNYLWSRLHSSPVIETIGLDKNAKGEIILPSSQHYRPCTINMFPVETEDHQTYIPITRHTNSVRARRHGDFRIIDHHRPY